MCQYGLINMEDTNPTDTGTVCTDIFVDAMRVYKLEYFAGLVSLTE